MEMISSFVLLITIALSVGLQKVDQLRVEVLERPLECELKSEPNDQLVVHYLGTLTNGTVFDSSRRRNETFSFTLGKGQVIPGWDQGMSDMCLGEKRRLMVPSELAYGEEGVGNVIPPDATLVFEVDLVQLPEKEKALREKKRKLAQEAAEAEKKNQAQLEARRRNQLEQVKSGAESFESKQRPVRQHTGSGDLQIQTLVNPEACRMKAKSGDMVTVHYAGYFTNSLKFDSSLDRNEPFTFKLGSGQVIPGWEQGTQGMCVGERRRLVIPPELAYGKRGVGDIIPADSTLIFDVQLIDIN